MRSKALSSAVVTFLTFAACGNGGMGDKPGTGGASDTGGQSSNGSGGRAGGTGGSAGGAATSASTGGTTGSGGTTASGGSPGAGGRTGAGGGTVASTGGAKATGGNGPGKGGATGAPTGGAQGTGGGSAIDGGSTVDCTTTMPTGGNTYTGSSVNGTANGLNYGIWATGDGGSITIFPNVHAFSASWSNVSDFLAHVGLDFNGSKSYTSYGTIAADFVESKTGTAGSWSEIGIYGWMHSPCVEWYINEDSFNSFIPHGSITATIDGATYYLSTSTTTGTGGANACESGHTGSWTNMTSTRATPRQCGTVTVSDHFAAWAKQGWNLGGLASVHINVEVGGGTGSIQFPLANVTTTSK